MNAAENTNNEEGDTDDLYTDEASVCVGGEFVDIDAVTYIRTKKGLEKIFNFSLKKTGVVSSKDSCGKWLFELKLKKPETGDYICEVALSSSAFKNASSLQLQLTALCANSFNMVYANVSPKILSSYIDWVQNQYLECEPRSYQLADYVGFHKPDYWVLSNKND